MLQFLYLSLKLQGSALLSILCKVVLVESDLLRELIFITIELEMIQASQVKLNLGFQ